MGFNSKQISHMTLVEVHSPMQLMHTNQGHVHVTTTCTCMYMYMCCLYMYMYMYVSVPVCVH